MSAKVDAALMLAAVESLRSDYARRAECGDQHAVFHLAVARWIEGNARQLEYGGSLSSCDSPGDVEAAHDIAAAWLDSEYDRAVTTSALFVSGVDAGLRAAPTGGDA